MAEQALRQRPGATPDDLAMIQRIKDQTGHDATRIALVRQRMASGVGKGSDAVPLRDVLLFMMVERELGLDSLLGQIHWIYRSGKGGHQVGIDGFRAIADRSGSYAGSEPPIFRGTLDQPFGDGSHSFLAPEEASVLVRKLVQGHVCSFVGVASWAEYYPSDERQNFMWRKMPRHMLAKVAEANALRKAFPAQLAGLPLADDEPGAAEPAVRVVEHGAAMYDRIYSEPEDQPMSDYERKLREDVRQAYSEDPAEPEPVIRHDPPAQEVGEEEAGPFEPPTAAPPPDPWVENRRLYFEAADLGLRPKTLRSTTAREQVEAYNSQLAYQIEQARERQAAGV